MNHHTLLPEKEIKSLRSEYRIRLFITLSFFISFSIIIGIVALIPAYIYSYTQEKSNLDKKTEMQKDRVENGIEELSTISANINEKIIKLKNHSNSIIFSELITQIISIKGQSITINSFKLLPPESNERNATSSMIIQGRSSTREALVEFKDILESEPGIIKVELPVSDLAKSKDIIFSFRLSIIPQNENK